MVQEITGSYFVQFEEYSINPKVIAFSTIEKRFIRNEPKEWIEDETEPEGGYYKGEWKFRIKLELTTGHVFFTKFTSEENCKKEHEKLMDTV